MDSDKAIQLIQIVERIDDALMQYCDLAEAEANNAEIRKAVAEIIFDIYLKLEVPIYREHPNLPNRRDV